VSDFTDITTGEITVVSTTIDALEPINTGSVVNLGQLTYNGSVFVDANNNEITPYSGIYEYGTLVEGTVYTVQGVYTYYSVNEILPRDANDIVEYVEQVPSITVDPATVNAPAEGIEGSLTVTYENITEVAADVYFCDANGEAAEYDWFDAEINSDNNVDYVIDANEGAARSAYFKVWAYDDEFNEVYSDLVTVNQDAASVTPAALYTYSINGLEGETLDAEVGATITLTDGEDLNDNFTFAGWTTNANDVSQLLSGEYTLTEEVTTFYAVYARTSNASMTIDPQTENFPDTYGEANTFTEYTLNGKRFMIQQVYVNQGKLQFRAAGHNSGTGTIYNSESLGTISSIILNYNSSDNKKNFTITGGSEANPTQGTSIEPTINQNEYTFDLSAGNYPYFVLTNGVNAGYLDNIIINYSGVAYYTRVFLENPTANVNIIGPSIVPSGYTLDMGSNALNNELGASKLIIEDGAQLMIANQVTGTMQKNITGYSSYTGENNGGYYLLASPTDGQVSNFDNFRPATEQMNEVDWYMFNQNGDDEGNEWINQKYFDSDMQLYQFDGQMGIQRGIGYLYARLNDVTLGFAASYITYVNPNTNQPETTPMYFVPTNEPYTVSPDDLEYTEGKDFAGWNLVGNPFTCDANLNRTYFRMNEPGDAIVEGEGVIKPCEGVFVVVTDTDKDVTFNASATASVVTSPKLFVNLNGNNQLMDRVSIHFDESHNIKKFVLNENAAKLFIQQGNNDYAIVCSDAQGEMPVNFKAQNNGTYTISVNAENVEMEYLHLIDNMTGADIDLLATPSYTFDANTTDYASRFRLVFNGNTVNENGNETFAYFNGSEWSISNTGRATLQVVDVLGRIVSSESVSGNATLSTDNLMSGVYMFRLINGENVKVQKVVVK
ncbi:MAG: T9SS type A sorting domain-containing protein, partial [Bacteroidales bacterium]|nr:T9SS type A sorting domain-containing protein [Bacteroidales bacterium]